MDYKHSVNEQNIKVMGCDKTGMPIVILLFSPRDWESEILGKNIYFLKNEILESKGYDSDITNIMEGFSSLEKEINTRDINIIYSRVISKSFNIIHALEKLGFCYIENLLTFTFNFKKRQLPFPNIVIRTWKEEDLEPLAVIGKTAFKYDRFHADPIISKTNADIIKQEWVLNSCKGYADEVLVAEIDNRCVGFITLKIKNETGIIDLIAVDPRYSGKGIGTEIIYGALQWFSTRVESVNVGTQSTNIASINMYTRCKFKLVNCQITLRKLFL